MKQVLAKGDIKSKVQARSTAVKPDVTSKLGGSKPKRQEMPFREIDQDIVVFGSGSTMADGSTNGVDWFGRQQSRIRIHCGAESRIIYGQDETAIRYSAELIHSGR